MRVFAELLSFVDRQTAVKVKKLYEDGEKMYFKQIAPVIKQRAKLEKKNKDLFNFKRGEISALNIINKVMPVLKKWFRRTDKRSQQQINDFVLIMYQYVTSRTPLSGKFVIAKGN